MRFEPAMVWRYNQVRRKYVGVTGTVITFSVVYAGPDQLKTHVPYAVGLIDLGSEKVMGQLVDMPPDQIRIGMSVRGVLRRLFEVEEDALHVYGVKFVKDES